MNKSNSFLIIFIVCMVISSYGQNQIEFLGTREKKPFHLVRTNGVSTYFIASNFADAKVQGSTIHKWEDNYFDTISFVHFLNDTLICNQIINGWINDLGLTLLTYSSHVSNGNNYLNLCKLDELTGEIVILDQEKIVEFRVNPSFINKDMVINGLNHHILLEHNLIGYRAIAVLKIKIENDNLELKRAALLENIHEPPLYDNYYDEFKKLFVLNMGRYIYVLDEFFNIVHIKPYNVLYNNITYNGPNRLMVGHDKDTYYMLDIIRNQTKGNSSLYKRETEYTDTFSFGETAISLNGDEDCYLVRKVNKEKYNYLFFSRSSVNNFDDNYGFNIWVLDKKGNLLKNHNIKLNRQLLLSDIDVNEELGLVYGAVYYYNGEQEVFKFKMEDISSVDEGEETETQNNIILNTLNDGIILFNKDIIGSGQIRIFDLQGKLIFTSTPQEELDVTYLPSGMYILNYTFGKVNRSQKMVIAK